MPVQPLRGMTGRSAALALVTLMAACHDPGSKMPTSPGLPPFAALSIVGPDNVAPGEPTQFTAWIRLADGTSKAATADTHVRWQSGDSSRLRVDGAGLATGQPQLGDTTLIAEVTGPSGKMQSVREVTVVPAGTYRVVGSVNQGGTSPTPIAGARVEVVSGSLTTTTDSNGQYRLFGVPANASVRVTAAGYESLEQSLRLTANATQHFYLSLSAPSPVLPGFSGPYALTIDTTAACAGMPTELRQRTYAANVTWQAGSPIDVQLTEPRFLTSFGKGNRFTGSAQGGTVTFTLNPYYLSFYYALVYPVFPDVAEQLSDGTVVVISGTASTIASGGGWSGTLNGGVANYSPAFPDQDHLLGGCFSSAIRFTLTPR